jgi:zinc transporter, ZIP family
MSSAEILLLGALAGLTIFIGLPMGRLHDVGQSFKAFLSATATGILLFLLWDVLKQAIGPVESALNASHWSRFAGLSGLAFGGFALGLLSLVYYDGWMKRRRRKSFLGPGAASATELERSHFTGLTPARWLALFIATGIGLHNFSEGLAIGQSAARDELSLAYVLVIGFGLHNATEGFGIVAPLSGDAEPPSWRFLGMLGLIGGVPTFLGTLVGQAWTSTAVSVAFLALAAGSILYVVMELLNVCRLFSSKTVTAWGVLLGLTLGFATDFILVGAGV